jgi:hypothetical protein
MKQTPLDLSCFRWIKSQTRESDRQALLSIIETVCSVDGSYRYLEVGSYLGGSLQPHVVDPRCVSIFSIDPRPSEQADERSIVMYEYEDNSTDKMLSLLAKIPGANINKIKTFETNSWDLSPADIPTPVEFAFIDGEHTNAAVLRDFPAVRRFLAPSSVLAFHDCFAVPGALLEIACTLKRESRDLWFLSFPHSCVVVVVFGSKRFADALLDSGWRRGFRISRLHSLRLVLKKTRKRIVSAVKSRGKRH